MMVVVVALTESCVAYKGIVGRVGMLVVGSMTPEVSNTVYKPCTVKRCDITERKHEKERHVKTFIPEVPGNKYRNKQGEDQAQLEVVPLLEHDHWVLLQVTQINVLSLDQHLRVFEHKEPTDVCKKEPTVGVVRICVRFRVLVVETVVPGPDKNGVLHSNAVEQHHCDLEGQLGLVCTMGPQPMSAGRHSVSATHTDENVPHVRLPLRLRAGNNTEHP